MNQRAPMFDGKVVIVTGAGGGIGRSHALAFAKEGAMVVVNDVGGTRDGAGNSSSAADQVVAEIVAAGGKAVANYDSVATMEGANGILKSALDAFGRVDVLVNNAGILRDKTLMKMEEAMWDAVISVHLKGTFCCTQVIGRKLIEQGQGGRIINTTSLAGLLGNFGQANYSAAKAGIYGFSMTVAMELRSKGITVNCVAPVAKTRMTSDIDAVPDEMKAEHITPIVLFLASDMAADVTGKVFGVHGSQIFTYVMKHYEGVTKANNGIWEVAEIHRRLGDIMSEGPAGATAPATAAAAASSGPAIPTDPVEAAFFAVPYGLDKAAAAGKSFRICFELKDGPAHTLGLKDGTLTVEKGKVDPVTCLVKTDTETLVAVFTGKLKAESAFMKGKITASNLPDMMSLGKVLSFAKAQEALKNLPATGAPAPATPVAAPAPAAAPAAPSDPVSEAFALVPLGFVAEKAAGKKFNIYFEVKNGPAHSLILQDGKLEVVKGQAGTPTCTTKLDAETAVGIFTAKIKAESAFMQGKVTASNIADMMTLGQVINAKKAQEALAAKAAAPAPVAPKADADPVSTVFGMIPLGFRADKAAGKKFRIYFDVKGGPGHTLVLQDGKLEVVKGQVESPTCITKLDSEVFIAVFTGKIKAESAFMQGKISASNVADMMTLGQVLDAKKAQELMAQHGTGSGTLPPAGKAGHPADMMGAAAPGADPVTEAFSILPQAFNKDKAGSWKACVHFEIKGSSNRTLNVAEGHVKVLEGLIGNADCVIKTDAETISGLLTGQVDGNKAFMQGKISANNMGVLMKFTQVFKFDVKRPNPAATAQAAVAAGAPAAPAAPTLDRKKFIGRKYDGGMTMVKAEHMMAYAKATNDENPAFLDTSRDGGIIAPPIFPVRLLRDVMFKVALDPDLELDLLRLVHGEQDMRLYAPIQPGDILQLRAQITDVQEKDSGTVVTSRNYAYRDGRLVVDAYNTLFIRGRAKKKEAGDAPKAEKPVEAAPVERPAPDLVETFSVDKDQPVRYAAASLDDNPIHLDETAARSGGLPGVILHGLCTMALSTRPFVALVGGDSTRMKRFSVRFAKPVFPGDTLTVKGWKGATSDSGVTSWTFEVENAKGVVVVSNGICELC